MKIFLSWSGEASHSVALALRKWLPQVLPHAKAWVSSEDIPKGRRWVRELDKQLEDTAFSIVCIVPGNVREPWINFESGAIGRSVEQAHVSPFLVGVGTDALRDSPLSIFQATIFEQEDVKRLLHTLNTASSSPIPEPELADRYRRSWPALVALLKDIPLGTAEVDDSDDDDEDYLLDEGAEKVLEIIGSSRGDVSVDDIARALKQRPVRTEHYIDQLLARRMIYDHLRRGGPVTYSLEAAGRAYLVENDLD